MNVEMRIARLLLDPQTGLPIVVLVEANGQRAVPIVIGIAEAEAIALGLQSIVSPRPRTHDLMQNIMTALGGHLEKIVIHDLRESTFVADLYVRVGDDIITIDSRPSDALGLATRVNAAIFMSEQVLESSRIRSTEDMGEKPSEDDAGEEDEDEDGEDGEEVVEVEDGGPSERPDTVSPVRIPSDIPREDLEEFLKNLDPDDFGKYKM